MGVDKGGHDDTALGVDDLSGGIFGTQRLLLAHLCNFGALKRHSAVLVVAPAIFVAGDESAVCDEIHEYILLLNQWIVSLFRLPYPSSPFTPAYEKMFQIS